MFWFLVLCFGFIRYAGNLPALIAGPDTPPAVLLSAPDPRYIGALIGALNAGQIGANRGNYGGALIGAIFQIGAFFAGQIGAKRKPLKIGAFLN